MRECARHINTLISTGSHICPDVLQLLSETVSKMSRFVKECWLCFAETSFFAVMKLHSLRQLRASLTWSTCVVLYWALVGGFTELKPFSALGKAPGLPWAVACSTACVFSAVELRPYNSVRFKNEGNLKMYSDWHLPFDWPGSAAGGADWLQVTDQHLAAAACPGLGLCWEETGPGREGDGVWHHLGKGVGESSMGRQGKGETCGPPQENEEVPGASKERSGRKSQLRCCGRREGVWEREVNLAGNIKTLSFPIQLLAASTVQN